MRWRLPFFTQAQLSEQSVRVPRIPEGQRVYAIGDVHGRFDLLVALVDRIRADNRARGAAEVHVVMLGDLVDRGAQSAQVIEFLRAQQGGFAEFHFVSGNHEEAMLASLATDADPDTTGWLDYGGYQTMASYGVDAEALDLHGPALAATLRRGIPNTHIDFISGFVDRVLIGDYLFVHAGIRPGVALDRQTVEDMRWIREPFLEDARDHGVVVVHGHSIRPEPEFRANRIGIDTGAWRSGILTALGLESDQRWLLVEEGAHG